MTEDKSSSVSGFYKLSIEDRRAFVKRFTGLSDEEYSLFSTNLDLPTADRMIENVIGTFELPLGLAVNFKINKKDYLIPMATEESSVVAAASNGAKMARIRGGFTAACSPPLMIGQIQLLHMTDAVDACQEIMKRKQDILNLANDQDKILNELGGGAKDLEVRIIGSPLGKMLVAHLIVDVRDAMGANAVNTMCEAIAPILAELADGKARLRILTNLADRRLVTAMATFDTKTIGGGSVVDAFLESYTLATVDPYRAATHNKGIMNGIDAVIVATSNDSRAIEAGAHAYAARSGYYTSLTKYEQDEEGNLIGMIELPMAVGIVGGAANMHPKAKLCRRILGISSAAELGMIAGSVGLAQNFAALLALSTVGIQKGHMGLHAKNIAVMAGAQGKEIDVLADKLVAEGKVKLDRAKALLEEMRHTK
jgi:hydroxymethylglutaryl-CoA reductase